MTTRVWRTIGAFGFFAMIGIVAAVPAGAVVFTISGGVPETGGITTPCGPPCVQPPGQPGIPVGTQGYVGQNPGGPSSQLDLSATPGTIIFHYLGSDAQFHNQFFVDLNHNGVFAANELVFDNQRANNPDVGFSHLGGDIPFEFVSTNLAGVTSTFLNSGPPTFNIFDACLPQTGGDPNPRTCSFGDIGFADGNLPLANDDHQDLGVQFRTPEPGTLSLLGAGLLGLGLVTFRRRKA